MKREVRKHDGEDKGKRGGITGEGGEFITGAEAQTGSDRAPTTSRGQGFGRQGHGSGPE